jgi:hypothetical protein
MLRRLTRWRGSQRLNSGGREAHRPKRLGIQSRMGRGTPATENGHDWRSVTETCLKIRRPNIESYIYNPEVNMASKLNIFKTRKEHINLMMVNARTVREWGHHEFMRLRRLTRWTQYRRYRQCQHRHRHRYNGIPPYVVGEAWTVGCTANLRGVRRETGSGEVEEGSCRHRRRDGTSKRNTKAGGHRILTQWW